MTWEPPSFVVIRMDAELSAYADALAPDENGQPAGEGVTPEAE